MCGSIYTHTFSPLPRTSQAVAEAESRTGSHQAGTGRAEHWRTDLGVPPERGMSFLCAYRTASPFCACTPSVGGLGGQGWGVQASQWDCLDWQCYAAEIHCSAGAVLAGCSRCHGKCGDPFPNLPDHEGAQECCGQEVKPASAIFQAEKNVGKSLTGGMEGPKQQEPWLGGPVWSKQGCWCHSAAAQGTTLAWAETLALPLPPQKVKRHSGFLAPLTAAAASWKACSAEP